jgi:hypothetical protein
MTRINVTAFPEPLIRPDMDKISKIIDGCDSDHNQLLTIARLSMKMLDRHIAEPEGTPEREKRAVDAASLAFFALGTVLGMFGDDDEALPAGGRPAA